MVWYTHFRFSILHILSMSLQLICRMNFAQIKHIHNHIWRNLQMEIFKHSFPYWYCLFKYIISQTNQQHIRHHILCIWFYLHWMLNILRYSWLSLSILKTISKLALDSFFKNPLAISKLKKFSSFLSMFLIWFFFIFYLFLTSLLVLVSLINFRIS